MTRKTDSISSELPFAARTRVRLPEPFEPARIFRGWGPELGR
jgi:hypothetical protein